MKEHSLTEHDEKNKTDKCINCHEANEKFNTKYNTNHAVWNKECSVYKRKMESLRKSFTRN
jgi:hypothetical protein